MASPCRRARPGPPGGPPPGSGGSNGTGTNGTGTTPRRGFFGGGGGFANNPKLRAAFQACGARFGFRGGQRFRLSRAALTKYLTCVHQHGYNLPNPNFSGKGPVFPSIIRTSAKFRAASRACQSLLTSPRSGTATSTTSGAWLTPLLRGRYRRRLSLAAVLRLRDVTKEYPGGVHALRGVSVEIEAGDQVAVVGPSGSGKTTMLTVLGTLERPSSGAVEVAGRDVVGASDVALAGLRAHEIGFVFQDFHLQDTMTAVDNVATGMLYTGAPARERREAARAALERVGLGHRLTHRPSQLSGGERQRVAIARAIAKRPVIVLADEPTGNLDSTSGQGVISLLHELAAEGSTLVLITHDHAVAEGFARRIQMRDGEIVGDDRQATNRPDADSRR